MTFALFYLIFFALDILLVLKFQAMGLNPMEYLVAGVGLFCSVIFLKQCRRFEILQGHRLIVRSFISVVFLTSLTSLSQPILFRFFGDTELTANFDFFREVVLLVCNLVIFISILVHVGGKDKLKRWMLLSGIGGILRYTIMRIDQWFRDPIPLLIWRYLGVFDMIMLFGWLMIIHTLMHAEDDAERSVDAVPSLR